MWEWASHASRAIFYIAPLALPPQFVLAVYLGTFLSVGLVHTVTLAIVTPVILLETYVKIVLKATPSKGVHAYLATSITVPRAVLPAYARHAVIFPPLPTLAATASYVKILPAHPARPIMFVRHAPTSDTCRAM
jgi:hypothetical protein